MATDPSSSGTDDGPTETTASEAGTSTTRRPRRVTRASAAWVATAVALLLLVLLIVFILQNSAKIEVQFLGMSKTIPLGMALFIAAVSGGVVVAIAGGARVMQLRMSARRTRRHTSSA